MKTKIDIRIGGRGPSARELIDDIVAGIAQRNGFYLASMEKSADGTEAYITLSQGEADSEGEQLAQAMTRATDAAPQTDAPGPATDASDKADDCDCPACNLRRALMSAGGVRVVDIIELMGGKRRTVN